MLFSAAVLAGGFVALVAGATTAVTAAARVLFSPDIGDGILSTTPFVDCFFY